MAYQWYSDSWTFLNDEDDFVFDDAVPGTGLGTGTGVGTWSAGQLEFSSVNWQSGSWRWYPPGTMLAVTGATLTGNWQHGGFDGMWIVYVGGGGADSGDPTATVTIGNNGREVHYFAWSNVGNNENKQPIWDISCAGFRMDVPEPDDPVGGSGIPQPSTPGILGRPRRSRTRTPVSPSARGVATPSLPSGLPSGGGISPPRGKIGISSGRRSSRPYTQFFRSGLSIKSKGPSTKMKIEIRDRSFANRLESPSLTYEVKRATAQAIGGPDRATIEIKGGLDQLYEFTEMLRSEVVLFDAYNLARWWGYIATVKVTVGGITTGVTLGGMHNSVKVAYSKMASGGSDSGERDTTGAAEDADSIAAYGTKELLASISDASATEAEELRDKLLAEQQDPIKIVETTGGRPAVPVAKLICKGWWDTLDWRYYNNAGTNDVVTTTQIGGIISAVGEFVNAIKVDDASGIEGDEFRDGDATARTEIIELLKKGKAAGNRLIAEVNRNRVLVVKEEPASTSDVYQYDSHQILYDPGGSVVDPTFLPVGFWCKLKDVLPLSAELSRLANPSPFFVEECIYDGGRGTLKLVPKDAPSVYDMFELIKD